MLNVSEVVKTVIYCCMHECEEVNAGVTLPDIYQHHNTSSNDKRKSDN